MSLSAGGHFPLSNQHVGFTRAAFARNFSAWFVQMGVAGNHSLKRMRRHSAAREGRAEPPMLPHIGVSSRWPLQTWASLLADLVVNPRFYRPIVVPRCVFAYDARHAIFCWGADHVRQRPSFARHPHAASPPTPPWRKLLKVAAQPSGAGAANSVRAREGHDARRGGSRPTGVQPKGLLFVRQISQKRRECVLVILSA